MIVTVTAYKRPQYLARCLESIANSDWRGYVDGRVIVSIDYSDKLDEMLDTIKRAPNGPPLQSVHYAARLGPANHTRALFPIAAMNNNDCIVSLEEDAIVAPDTFRLAKWAMPQCDILNLAPVPYPYVGHRDPDVLHEDFELRTPYGWAFTVATWRKMAPYWNGKIREPYGWDWWVTTQCYRDRLRVLTPDLSRVRHIGRDEGTYCTPEWFDAQPQPELCAAPPDSYRIVGHTRPATMPEWVERELNS